MTELQIRNILKELNVPTFPRPKGIPMDYRVVLSRKGAGMIYVHPTNNNISIRVMPGKPHSDSIRQRKPYVVHRIYQNAYDAKGKKVDYLSEDAHIPLEEYLFRSE